MTQQSVQAATYCGSSLIPLPADSYRKVIDYHGQQVLLEIMDTSEVEGSSSRDMGGWICTCVSDYRDRFPELLSRMSYFK